MKNKNLLPLWCLLPFLLAGCRSLYIPNMLPTPDLQGAGDFNMTVTSGVGESFLFIPTGSALDLQGAFAVTDHVAVISNFSTLIEIDPEYNKSKHHFFEGGMGWYGPLDKSAKTEEGTYGFAFAGFGGGKARDPEELNLLLEGRYQRFFIQPGLGYRSKLLEIGAAGRLSLVHFSQYKEYHGGDLVESSKFNFATFEPVGYFGIGGDKIKFYAQMGITAPLESKKDEGEVTNFGKVASDPSSIFHFHMGVTLRPFRKTQTAAGAEPETAAPLILTQGQVPVILLDSQNVKICLKEPGRPDGDIVSVFFNGTGVLEKLELRGDPECFEVTLIKPGENKLLIAGISDGAFQPNSLQLSFKYEGGEQVFFVRTKAGRTEEIILKVR